MALYSFSRQQQACAIEVCMWQARSMYHKHMQAYMLYSTHSQSKGVQFVVCSTSLPQHEDKGSVYTFAQTMWQQSCCIQAAQLAGVRQTCPNL